jgi:hypothetical protein
MGRDLRTRGAAFLPGHDDGNDDDTEDEKSKIDDPREPKERVSKTYPLVAAEFDKTAAG